MDLMTRRAAADPVPTPTPAESPVLRWSPAWALEPARPAADFASGRDTTLVLSAGADRRVAIDGVDADQRATVERWSAAAAVTDPASDVAETDDEGVPNSGDGGGAKPQLRRGAMARLLDRLVELGVVVPVTAPGPPTVVADDSGTAAALGDLLTEGGAAGMVVLVRTGAAWPSTPPGRLHLGVDVSLHHTVVLGPLVVPGASACLACLDARAARRWSAPTVPAAPAVLRRLPVVAALLDVQLGLVAAGTSPLVNATVAWNLETGTTDRQSLYKLAGCTRCDTGPAGGRVTLPWGAAP